jgi:hydrogenase maturation protease
VAKYLKENAVFTPAVEIVDGGTLGFGLMPLLQEFDAVVIANTASDDALSPGTVLVRGCDDFLEESQIKKTANEVEIAEMLQICSLTPNMAGVTIVSIVPEDIVSVEVGLSTPMKTAWPEYIAAVVAAIEDFGAKAQLDERMDLDSVVELFADPSIERQRGF